MKLATMNPEMDAEARYQAVAAMLAPPPAAFPSSYAAAAAAAAAVCHEYGHGLHASPPVCDSFLDGK